MRPAFACRIATPLVGSASAQMDLTILGLPAGTQGVAVFEAYTSQGLFGTASWSVTGATSSLTVIPGNIWSVFDFVYGQPIHITAQASDFCSECIEASLARLVSIQVYDGNLNQLSTAYSAGELIVAPEPAAWLLITMGLLALAWLRARPYYSGDGRCVTEREKLRTSLRGLKIAPE